MSHEYHVQVPVAANIAVNGDLRIPQGGTRVLEKGGLATLLFDLLTPEEEYYDSRTAQLRFNIDMLAERVAAAVEWLNGHRETKNMNIGLFGASTGGGAAIVAATRLCDKNNTSVKGVVSRGGRPDLAKSSLPKLTVPTLLLVGGRDEVVIDLNKKALNQMTHLEDKDLKIIEGATHLFEEPGTLEQVAEEATKFFVQHLNK